MEIASEVRRGAGEMQRILKSREDNGQRRAVSDATLSCIRTDNAHP